MVPNELMKNVVQFFKTARHLWGKCPSCGELFRLPDAAISFGAKPPKDWLRRVAKEKKALMLLSEKLNDREIELQDFENEIMTREDEAEGLGSELLEREKRLDREVKQLAIQLAKSDGAVRKLLLQERKDAALKSRATLIGRLFERLAPFGRKFKHDPRDLRAIMDPIDYVCFDGLTEFRRVSKITFIEIKSGAGLISPCQRSILDAVNARRIETEVITLGTKKMSLE